MQYNRLEKLLALNLVISFLFLASNSVLCKLAFVDNGIDPASFTAFRLIGGAAMLLALIAFQTPFKIKPTKTPLAGLMLFLYAIAFSYSYVHIDTGVGALILFGAVQMTMLGYAVFKKDVLSGSTLLGAVIAFIGLWILVFPTQNYAISLWGAFLMALAGIAWAVYCIIGKNICAPLHTTYSNFLYASILVLLFIFFNNDTYYFSSEAVGFALISGALTSGIGYVLWYYVVQKIQTSTASIIQLFIPVLSTIGGIVFLNEHLSFQLIIATITILSGIAISMRKKRVRNG
jgi:drug/metabolite transporter (DMT)-like permease